MTPRSPRPWPSLFRPPSLPPALTGLAGGGPFLALPSPPLPSAPLAGLPGGLPGGGLPLPGGVGFFSGFGSFRFAMVESQDATLPIPAALRRVLLLLFVLVFFFFPFVFDTLFPLLEDAALGVGDLLGQVAGVVGTQQHFFLLADAIFPEPKQAFVEEEHAVFPPRLDAGIDAVNLVLAD